MAYQIFKLVEERGREIHQIGRSLSNVTGQAQGAHPGGAKKSLEFKNYDRLCMKLLTERFAKFRTWPNQITINE